MSALDLTGQRFGRLIAQNRLPKDGRHIVWECACDCGQKVAVKRNNLTSKRSSSCGCLRAETLSARAIVRNTRHGHNKTGAPSITWMSWAAMLKRCRNPKHKSYADYGGRGITVCERWHNFENFLADMSERPSRDHSIDRTDVNGNYEPGNCRWATRSEQQRNKRCSA